MKLLAQYASWLVKSNQITLPRSLLTFTLYIQLLHKVSITATSINMILDWIAQIGERQIATRADPGSNLAVAK